MSKIDYKNKFKELYHAKTEPTLIEVPEITFLQIKGRGNPNDENGTYKVAVETLYTLSYAIKMMPKYGLTPPGYFDYVVAPLEGLWWLSSNDEYNDSSKSQFCWKALIRQPEFLTENLFALACDHIRKKKPHLDLSRTELVSFTEGLCVQCLHQGSFDSEASTLEKIHVFMDNNHLESGISNIRHHHELYLSDPRKIEISKMKTILRHPVKMKVLK